jgi:RHS repeat-associated protein
LVLEFFIGLRVFGKVGSSIGQEIGRYSRRIGQLPTKLAKKVYGNTAGNTARYDYSGNFLYENSVLKCIFTSEGRIVAFNNNGTMRYNFEYNLKDHLGNTRVVLTAHSDGKPETNQITSYDPFGFVTKQDNWYATSVLKNKYLYNGKEIQNDILAGTSLDWYDYGARMYDASLGRWHTEDLYPKNPKGGLHLLML